MSFFRRLVNDLNPFDGPQQPKPAPVQTPAPAQANRPVASTVPRPAYGAAGNGLGVLRPTANPTLPTFKPPVQPTPQVQPPKANIAQRLVNQVNPFDNGRTFKQIAPVNNRSVAGQLTHNGATNLAGNLAKATVAPAVSLAKTDFINPTRQIAAQFSGNRVAAQNAQLQTNRDLGLGDKGTDFTGGAKHFVGNTANLALTLAAPGASKGLEAGASRLIPQAAPQLVRTLVPRVSSNAALGAGFGASSTLAEGGNVNDILKSAGTNALVGGAIPVAGKLAQVGGNRAVQAAQAGVDIAERKPFRTVPDSLIPSLGRVSKQRQGFGEAVSGVRPEDYSVYRDVQNHLGVDANNHEAIDNLLGARQTFETQRAVRNQKLQSLPSIGLSMKAVDDAGNPVSALSGKPVTLPSGFAKGAQRSAEVSPEAKAILKQNQPTYEKRNTAALADSSAQLTKTPKQLNKLTDNLNERLAAPTGQIDDKTVSDTIAAAKAHDAAGNHDQASALYENLSDHLTKQGQSIQAASLLGNRTPEGIKLQATRALKKGNVEQTPELKAKLNTAYEKLKSTKEGSDERFRAAQEYSKIVADSLPQSAGDKIAAFWKAGLLTGIKTQTGNLLSNGTFGVLHGISNIPAAGIDKLISLKTGERTKTLTGKGYGSGLTEGLKASKGVLKTGIDERPGLANKYDSSSATFGNQHAEVQFGKSPLGKAATTYVNGVFRLMGAADRPAYYSQLRNSLADMANAAAKNQNLTGAKARTFIKDFRLNPPKEAFQRATNEAEKAVLGNDTFLSNIAGRVRGAADSIENPLGREAAKLGTNVLMPFTKVPSAFISRVLDYTPVGAVKEIASQAVKKQLDQRALSTAIAEAGTGTGLIFLGTELAKNGLLSGNYPDDPKEQARWKAEGIQSNSVKVNGGWQSLNYFGPLGALFSQGQRASDTIKYGGNVTDVASGFTGGAVQDALGQSFLQGVSGALDAVNDPKRYAQNYVRNQAGSIVPTLSKDIAEAGDSKQRDTNTVAQSLQSRIPGARETLPVKQDVYGNQLDRKAGAASTLANPLRTSKDISKKSIAVAEVDRLHNVNPNNKDLQVTPTPVDKAISVEGKQVKLNDKQRYDLQTQIGQSTQSRWNQLIQTPEYQALSDIDKAKALNNLRSDSSVLAQREYVTSNNLGTYAKSPTKRQIALAQGNIDVASYANGDTTQSTSNTVAKITKAKTSKTKVASSRKGSSSKLAKLTPLNYGGTSKVTNAALAGIKSGGSSRNKVAKGKVALKGYTPTKASIKKPALLRRTA